MQALLSKVVLKRNTAKGRYNFSSLRSMGSTGSPLSGDAFDWFIKKSSDLWLTNFGWDRPKRRICSWSPECQCAGEMQCRALDAVHALMKGNDLIDQVGELVCTRPLPSMPLCCGEIKMAHAYMKAILTPIQELGVMGIGSK